MAHIALPPLPSSPHRGRDDEPDAASDGEAGAAADEGSPQPGGDGGAHIDFAGLQLIPAAAPTPRYVRRSPALMQHARDQRRIKGLEVDLMKSQKKKGDLHERLALAATCMPAVGPLLGLPAKRLQLHSSTTSPRSYCALALVAFLSSSVRFNTGVNRKRLVCAVAALILARQRTALERMLHAARTFVAQSAPRTWVVLTYGHEWDETRSWFRRHSVIERTRGNHRQSNVGVHIQTMVQRGRCGYNLHDFGVEKQAVFTEEWLVPPLQVEGTAATDLHGALVAHLPDGFRWVDPAASAGVANAANVIVFMPLGDKASANVSMLKRYGFFWKHKLLPMYGPKIMMLAESCQAHSHHRGKSSLPRLKEHVAKHFSLGHLYKLPDVQKNLTAFVEDLVQSKFRRFLHPPAPAGSNTTRLFFDTLFHLNAPHHERHSGKSTLLQHISGFLDMANGPPPCHGMDHHCRETVTSKPCCTSLADSKDKFMVLLLNLVLGSSDRQPTESRWTDALTSFKRTLLRRFLYDASVHKVLKPTRASAGISIDDEAGALAEFFKEINGIRGRRAHAYLTDNRNLWEVTVLAVVMDEIDRLFYAILGGDDRKHRPCQVERLLNRETSLVGDVQSRLLGFLDGARCVVSE